MTPLAIDIQNLSKSFSPPLPRLRKLLRRSEQPIVHALRDVTLSVDQGEIFGLVGRNGQGKTTLIKSACGLLEPSRGTARVFGHDTVSELTRVKGLVGLVSADERTFYWRLTGRQNLMFFGQLHDVSGAETARRIETLSELFEVGSLLDRNFQEYSTGNKQRLAIVRALLPNPPLLLLDEPTRSLDPISAEGLRKVLARWVSARPENTVLITTHNLSEIERLCGRVAILSRGRIIECDSMDVLVQKYLGNERVLLEVRRPPTPEWLRSIGAWATDVVCSETRQGTSLLSFMRQVGDGNLDRMLRELVLADLGIVACDTEHFGLQQILERIEANQAALEGAQP